MKFRGELSARQFAFVMNLPTLVFLGAVLAYPVIFAGYLSVHKVGLAQLRRGEFPFSGWENYGRVLEDPLFWVAIKNTLIFTAVTVISEIVLAIAIALLINQTSVWTSRFTRFLILLPYAIPPICNGLIWSFLYSFQFGFLNRLLFSAGLIDDPVNWAGNPTPRSMPCRCRTSGAPCPSPSSWCMPRSRASRASSMSRPRSTAPTPGIASGRSPCRCCNRSSPSS